ncbi:hypothetical protein DL93DRAFT_2057600 [Clavulina sp. PMI_390]|nr:hypothetical protein DL93DRAFT_2057600 [Clavulina sp. PMI_390]
MPWVASPIRSKSSYMLRSPPPSSPREFATPLVFLSAKAWDHDSSASMRSYAAMFSERGYTTMEIDLGLPEPQVKSSEELMHHFELELASHIRLAAIPFAPVLFARRGGALIAQTYISSNPASGMVLISPPVSNDAPEARAWLPTPLQEFDYEPRFPLLIIDSDVEHHAKENRLVRDDGVETLYMTAAELGGMSAWMKIEKWMDSVGI